VVGGRDGYFLVNRSAADRRALIGPDIPRSPIALW
jgi:hypothetical protein